MPYIYSFTKELEQFGLCSFRLSLTDSDSVLPDLNIPIVFRSGEETEEKIQEIALRMIEENTPLPPVVEEPVVEEPVVEEPVVEEPVVEEPVVEEPVVEEPVVEEPVVEEPVVEEPVVEEPVVEEPVVEEPVVE